MSGAKPRKGSGGRKKYLDVEVWCPDCGEFHQMLQDDEFKNIYHGPCGRIVSVREEAGG